MKENQLVRFKEQLKGKSEDYSLLLEIGLLELELGKSDKAIESFTKALYIYPDSDVALAGMAQAYEQKDDLNNARNYFEKSISIKATPARYVLLGSIEERLKFREKALACYEKALDLDMDYVEAMYSLGVILRDAQPEMAVTYLRRAVERDPNYAVAFQELGSILLGLGRIQEAIDALKRNIALGDVSYLTHLFLGNALLRQRKIDDAEEEFKRAVELDGSDFSWYQLGRFYMAANRGEEAKCALEKAININPDNDLALRALQKCC